MIMTTLTITNVRNPVKCRACDALLLVECLRISDGPAAAEPLTFACPECAGLNRDVPLYGCEVMAVIRDPRSRPRE